LERYYNVGYTVVALVFLAPFFGYTAAAFLNNRIHMKFGQRGIAIFAPCCKIVTYVITCLHPPYAVLPVVFVLAGFGNGLEDGGWNAWVGGMANANELMGILHGAYGLGATISPLVATAMVAKADLPWYTFYYVLVCYILIPASAL
jgi:fucose permease